MSDSRKLTGYVAPMAVFIGLLAVNSFLKWLDHSFWLSSSEYWIYPLQTVLCGALIILFWRSYSLNRPIQPGFGAAIGLLVFVIWIAPQMFFGAGPRAHGFDPDVFAGQPLFYWSTVTLRFARLAIVVPFVEEIFWRGFLLRYLINEEFDQIPFGKFSWLSFAIVTIAFAAAHSPADWPAAIITGALYNVVGYRTKSLATCVLTHATTNLVLGIWIMQTKQWGFW